MRLFFNMMFTMWLQANGQGSGKHGTNSSISLFNGYLTLIVGQMPETQLKVYQAAM